MLNKFKKSNHKGYTLIEILVGITVFSILMAASVEFFSTSLMMQQKALLSQRLLDSVSYSFEYMGRALRMAKKDTDAKCIAKDQNYELTRGEKGIKFLNYNEECWEFYWETVPNSSGARSLMFIIDNNSAVSLSSEFLDVVSFKIFTSGLSDDFQPRITLFLNAKMIKNNNPNLQPSIEIQTTVSQRDLDY